jgi:hypothetical protein
MFSAENPLLCSAYEYSRDVKKGMCKQFRVVVESSSTSPEMMANPSCHGLKNISEFSMDVARIPAYRRAHILESYSGIM